MAIKTMTLDEIKKLPPVTESEIQQIQNFDEKFDDPECPPLSSKQISRMKKLREIHPEWYKPTKTEIHMRVDTDVLEWFKSQGKGYQTKMNEVLRNFAFSMM